MHITAAVWMDGWPMCRSSGVLRDGCGVFAGEVLAYSHEQNEDENTAFLMEVIVLFALTVRGCGQVLEAEVGWENGRLPGNRGCLFALQILCL